MERSQNPDRLMDKEALRLKLINANIPLEKWGVRRAKTVEDLLVEITEGETELFFENGQIVRRVHVVAVNVLHLDDRNQAFKLVEKKQVTKDGMEVARNLTTSIGEKRKITEDVEAATKRALYEELGITFILSMDQKGQVEIARDFSMSYPGLPTIICGEEIEVVIDPREYVQEGYVERQSAKSTFFEWQPLDYVQSRQ